MAYLLHIDTGWSESHVGLSHNGHMIEWCKLDNQKQQAALLAPMIQTLLQKQNIQLKNLCAIAILNGPGSYTGLRIGMSHAKGYAYGLDIPIVINSYLDALKWSAQKLPNFDENKRQLYLLKARRGEYFGLFNEENGMKSIPQHLSAEKCKEILNFNKEGYQIISLEGQLDGEDINFFNGYYLLFVQYFMYDVWAANAYNKWQNGDVESFLSADCQYLKAVFLTQKAS